MTPDFPYTLGRQGSDAGFSFVPAFLSNSPSSVGSYPGATLAGTQAEFTVEDFCFMPNPEALSACSVENCLRGQKGGIVRGLCYRHYQAWRQYGDPLLARGHASPAGAFGTPEYKSWSGMKSRCYTKSHKRYPLYGGLGVTVCARWLESFANFLTDMGPKPTPKHSIDRYPDPFGNYEPDNCRWATQTEQCRNRRNTKFILEDAVQMVLAYLGGESYASIARRFKCTESLPSKVVSGEIWKGAAEEARRRIASDATTTNKPMEER